MHLTNLRSFVATCLTGVVVVSCSDATGPHGGPQVLYVANSASHELMAFALPLTSASAPLWRIPNSYFSALAADRTGDVVACGGRPDTIYVFSPPLSASSIPGAAIHVPVCYLMTFDRQGRLFTSIGRQFEVYVPPFSSSAVPTNVALDSVVASSVAFDDASRLYVGFVHAQFTSTGVRVYVPPYTSPAFTITKGLSSVGAITTDRAGNLYVLNWDTERIVVFHAPISASSDSAFSFPVTNGLSPLNIVVDAAGNMMMNDQQGSDVHVFPGPLSATSVERFALHLPPPANLGPATMAITP